MSTMNNYNYGSSGYNTPDLEHEITQYHNPIPVMYHTQGSQHPHIPSPPLSDILPPTTPTYPVPPPTSYIPTTHGGHQVYSPPYPQQTVSYARYAGDRRRSSPEVPILEQPPMQTRRQLTISTRKESHHSHSHSHPHPYYPTKRRGGGGGNTVHISDDDDDELGELPPNATDQQKIEHQRHRNTLAARRSRKRKELYKQELEQRVEHLTMETEKWRTRAEMLRRIIEGQGLGICPDWSE